MIERLARILITGGAGFIGSTLVRQCLKQDELTVINLDSLTYAGHVLSLADVAQNPRHVFVEGDIADASLVADVLREYRPQAIMHLAAETHVDRSIVRPTTFAQTNVVGSCELLDAVTSYWQGLPVEEKQSFRFLLVSTDEVFGSTDETELFDEESPIAPNSPYAASKAAAELFARAFAKTFGLPILVANPSNNYGARQHPEKLIPKMILTVARGEPLPVYGDGLHQRDWLHVEDCCRALMAILFYGNPGDRFTIGGSNCLPNLAVVERICDQLDDILADGRQRRRLITQVADRPGHDRCYAVSSCRLKTATGWQPQIPFDSGLRETVEWYLDHSDWVNQIQEPNLPK